MPYFICSKAAADGACCLKVFQNGIPFTIILASGTRCTMSGCECFTPVLKKKRVGQLRTKQRRKSCKKSFLIVDAQSVKNTGSAQGKGYEAEKKICRIT